jgi:soluble lytic murein transglycosylase-like protein
MPQVTDDGTQVTAIVRFMHEKINPGLALPLSQQYARAVLADAQLHQIDPCLLIAIVGIESHFKAEAVSKHGAIGLGQLLPSTAQELHVDPTSPLSNLWGTSRYLSTLLHRFSFERQAIAAYNAGPGAISRNHGDPTSASNAVYVRRVMDLFEAAKQRLGFLALNRRPTTPYFVLAPRLIANRPAPARRITVNHLQSPSVLAMAPQQALQKPQAQVDDKLTIDEHKWLTNDSHKVIPNALIINHF